MPIPALSASFFTVATSHDSDSLRGLSITCAPVDHLAIDLDIRREMMAPVKPTNAEKTSSPEGFSPLAASMRFSPSTLLMIDSTTITAMLVARNRMIRFMAGSGSSSLKADFERRSGMGGHFLAPGVAKGDGRVKNGSSRARIAQVGDKVPVALELEARFCFDAGKCRLNQRLDHALAVRVDIVEEIALG